jgi:hypothetical protein
MHRRNNFELITILRPVICIIGIILYLTLPMKAKGRENVSSGWPIRQGTTGIGWDEVRHHYLIAFKYNKRYFR